MAVAAAMTGCRQAPREFELIGQVLAVDAARQELTVKHQDIRGFMPGMTMAFKVRDGRFMEGRTTGELVRATLVVQDADVYLRDVVRTGVAPIDGTHAATRVMDVIDPGEEARDATLLTDAGQPLRLSDLRGRILAVTFIYTRCPLPNFCPLIDRQFKAVQTLVLADPALRGAVQLLSISIDPAHDSPAVLARHAAGAGADPAIWRFLTGERSEVEAFAAQFGVSVIREDGADIVHNLRTAIIDGTGRLVTTMGGGEWRPEDLVTEVRRARTAR